MSDKKGIIYILTNPSFLDYVKTFVLKWQKAA